MTSSFIVPLSFSVQSIKFDPSPCICHFWVVLFSNSEHRVTLRSFSLDRLVLFPRNFTSFACWSLVKLMVRDRILKRLRRRSKKTSVFAASKKILFFRNSSFYFGRQKFPKIISGGAWFVIGQKLPKSAVEKKALRQSNLVTL